MLISGVQKSESVIHIHIPVLFQILFHVDSVASQVSTGVSWVLKSREMVASSEECTLWLRTFKLSPQPSSLKCLARAWVFWLPIYSCIHLLITPYELSLPFRDFNQLFYYFLNNTRIICSFLSHYRNVFGAKHTCPQSKFRRN